MNLALSQVGIREDANGGTKFHKWFMESPFAEEDARRDGSSIGDFVRCDPAVRVVR